MKLKTYICHSASESYQELEVECEVIKTPIIDFAIFKSGGKFMAFEVTTGMAFGVKAHDTFEECESTAMEMIEIHGRGSFKRVMKSAKIINEIQ